MEADEGVSAVDIPLHLQQLKHTAAALLRSKITSDSVTWVPDTVPEFVRNAVEEGLRAADHEYAVQSSMQDRQQYPISTPCLGPATDRTVPPPNNLDNSRGTADAAVSLAQTATGTTAEALTAAAVQQPSLQADAPTQPAVILGSQHLRSGGGGSHSKRVDWVVTTCLVPDGMPTAAAADAGGGLAALEVVCRVLVLQDCQPAAASPGLVQALKKVRWQEFGLAFKEFYSSTGVDDPTGILTLGVLPDAVVTPLASIVCSCIPITTPSAGIAGSADLSQDPDTQADDDNLQNQPPRPAADSTQAAPAAVGGDDNADTGIEPNTTSRKRNHLADVANTSRKRKKGPHPKAAAPVKPPSLSSKREKELYVAAFEAALVELKGQLPPGYLQGKLESLVIDCLPSIAKSLANILMRSSNARNCDDACNQLSCEPLQLQQHLLNKLQATAADALAAKSQLAANRKQQRQQQRQDSNKVARAAAEAAAVAAAAGDGMGYVGDEDEQVMVEQQQQQLAEGPNPELQHDPHQLLLLQQQLPRQQQQQPEECWQLDNWQPSEPAGSAAQVDAEVPTAAADCAVYNDGQCFVTTEPAAEAQEGLRTDLHQVQQLRGVQGARYQQQLNSQHHNYAAPQQQDMSLAGPVGAAVAVGCHQPEGVNKVPDSGPGVSEVPASTVCRLVPELGATAKPTEVAGMAPPANSSNVNAEGCLYTRKKRFSGSAAADLF